MQKHILVAVGADFSHAALALALGIARARECHARLTALHVVDRMPWWAVSSVQYDYGSALTYVDMLAREVEKRTLQAIRASSIDGAYVMMDLPGGMTLARTIAQAAREFDADLIVIGRTSALGWRFWEERVADAVSRHSNRRVLIASNHADGGADTKAKGTRLRYTTVHSTQPARVPSFSSRGSSPCRTVPFNRVDTPC